MQERVLSNPKITILWNTECIKADGDGEILKSLEISDNQTKSTKTLDVG